MATQICPVQMPPGTLVALIRRSDLPNVLRLGYLAQNMGGPAPLGSPSFLEKRAAMELPPPYRPDLRSYVGLKFSPLSPSTYAVLTGNRREFEPLPRDELVFLQTSAEWLRALRHAFVFGDMGIVSRRARFYSDLQRLDQIDFPRLGSGDFDAKKDPLAPHLFEAEFMVWSGLHPRAIQRLVCADPESVPALEGVVAAAGRSGGVAVCADPSFYFQRI